MDEMETLLKHAQMVDLLLDGVLPIDFAPYFDVDSKELLDEKIEVLQALKDGKAISEILNFYEVLELLPPDGEIWD